MVIELSSSEDFITNAYDLIGNASDIVTTFSGVRDGCDYAIKVFTLVNGRTVSLVEQQVERIPEPYLKISDNENERIKQECHGNRESTGQSEYLSNKHLKSE